MMIPAETSFAPVAALLGEPARAAMMMALMDGSALSAKELAYAARVSAATASAHLRRLLGLGLVAVAPRGRNRYYRIASPRVAEMIEAMALAAPADPPRPPFARTPPELRLARTCYDHLAGLLGVAIADSLQRRGHVVLADGGGMVTASGHRFLADLGVPLTAAGRRIFCRPCLDWTERRHHLAGTLGAALCRHCLDAGWVARQRDTRALVVATSGRQAFAASFGIETDRLAEPLASVAA
jgi:DNA-binding transcriptional ArsR family regulator